MRVAPRAREPHSFYPPTSAQAYIIYVAVATGFTYPVASHWVNSASGWLSPVRSALGQDAETFRGSLGLLDYAGGSIVHAQGGVAALVAVYMLGARWGRFTKAGTVVGLHTLEARATACHTARRSVV